MPITAINTLEVKATFNPATETYIRNSLELLNDLEGCLGYSLLKSSRNTQTWILSGYWKSHDDMLQHLSSPLFSNFIERLERYSTQLTFGSFVLADYAPAD